LTRRTFGEASEFSPIWAPDGQKIYFNLERPQFDIYQMPADGSAPEEPVWPGYIEEDSTLTTVSPDGERLAFQTHTTDTGWDLWVAPIAGDRPAEPFRRTPYSEKFATFSPDGRWIAHESDESGQAEIYVQAHPGPAGRVQVSVDGGTEPLWASRSGELFYRNGSKMMAVRIRTGSGIEVDAPSLLFEGDYYRSQINSRSYDVTADGQRLVMIKTPEASAARHVNVVLNWFEELERLVPVN
jgi:Tol biopolymer transport system component